MPAFDVAIVGGGISGLTTGYTLAKARPDLKTIVVEQRSRLGGLISTVELNGFLFEQGPDSLVEHKPEGIHLVHELGLSEDLISSSLEQSGALLWAKGSLHPFPVGILMRTPIDLNRIGNSSLLSREGKRRAYLEPQVLPSQEQDESVHDFFTRRFGLELAQLLAAPIVAGVYGGDSRCISLKATFPKLFEMERTRGFVSGATPPVTTALRRSPFVSLRRGLGQLIGTLKEKLSGTCVFQTDSVTSVSPAAPGYQIVLGSGSCFPARMVVIATQAPRAYGILCRHFPDIANLLNQIPYAPSAIACFGFSSDVTSHLTGTGLLVPPGHDPDLLAATWVHHKFPGRCPPGKALVRCFLTAEAASRRWHNHDTDLAETFRAALQRIIGVTSRPDVTQVHRWVHGLPQYTLGHLDRIRRLTHLLSAYEGLYCVGNYFDGVGIADAVRKAREIAHEIARKESDKLDA